MDRTSLTFTRREAIGTTLVAAAFPLTGFTQDKPIFRPEDFGARGDGLANDTDAFARMARAVNQAGGGRVELRHAVYIVGEQLAGRNADGFAFAPKPILHLAQCYRGIVIDGRGATLRCAPGLRYGTFDGSTGRRVDLPMPNIEREGLATPYDYMVLIEACHGPVIVTDLELDGANEALRIGGPWGDVGRQIPCDGLFLSSNFGDEIVRNLHSHHHGRDGVMLSGPALLSPGTRRSFTGVRSESNGRQGCSLIGGRGYAFADCLFARSGRGPVSTPPGAGFDIEAERAPIQALRFDRCTFEDNAGCGLVADSGDSADAAFLNCRFIGTTNWSIWPNKPGFRFDRCEIVGACVRFFGSPDPARAVHLFDCHFTDSPFQSAERLAYVNGPMVDLSDSRNILFDQCRFDAAHGARLPWSTGAIYQDCVMRQIGGTTAYPRGSYIGHNRIDGPVDIAASRVHGQLVINGKPIAPRP